MDLKDSLEQANESFDLSPDKAREQFLSIVLSPELFDDASVKTKEEALYQLARLYVKQHQFEAVMGVLQQVNPFFSQIPKAKTAKIVRNVIEIVSAVSDALEVQISLCQQVVDWCVSEKRSFLRQRIQSKLAFLMFKNDQCQEALALVSKLLKELKKLDDKQLLVETHLVEARIQHALRNIPKAKASLTTARTNGNAIYVPPLLQGEIDSMSGTLATEEGDYSTAFSYFLEAFEGFANAHGPHLKGDPRANVCLQHMILCKVLQGAADEVPGIVSKWGAKYPAENLEGLVSIARAAKQRSLEEFDATLRLYSEQLENDVLVSHHLGLLYDNLLEDNLLKIIEPFSCVELSRIAELIKLPITKVEKKLSQMILDKRFPGILDQGRGQLIVYDEDAEGAMYESAVQIIGNMDSVVDSLFKRAQTVVN